MRTCEFAHDQSASGASVRLSPSDRRIELDA
jgi:hypothetical protein